MSSATPEELVDAISDIYGRHEGRRAVHAKGVLCTGTFTATPEAAGLTTAAHMSGEPLRATVRFSNGSGDPGHPDHQRDGRGLALKVYLPDGSTTDVIGLTLPLFFVRTPEDFLEFTRARRPDPETGKPDMARVGAFLEAHPEALPAIQASLAIEPPASYAQCEYHSIHAFAFVAADGARRFVRYRFEPEAGTASLSDDEARQRGPDYLSEELRERLEQGPAAFRVHLRLAEEGDDPDDPTVAWPDEREELEIGRLEITGPDTEREQGDDVLVFDPTRVTDGIECSGDAILHARSTAYSVSVERRSGVPRPAAPVA